MEVNRNDLQLMKGDGAHLMQEMYDAEHKMIEQKFGKEMPDVAKAFAGEDLI
jgi:hypothetical protein